MKPVHEHFEDLMRGRIDRRTFFKRVAATSAVTPVIANYLAAPAAASHVPASYNRFSLTRAAGRRN